MKSAFLGLSFILLTTLAGFSQTEITPTSFPLKQLVTKVDFNEVKAKALHKSEKKELRMKIANIATSTFANAALLQIEEKRVSKNKKPMFEGKNGNFLLKTSDLILTILGAKLLDRRN